MDKVREKKKIIKDIELYLEDIIYIRNNYIFESELEFEQVVEMELGIKKTWLIYTKLLEKKYDMRCDRGIIT